jgi:ribosomal-protein-alanine N-acetyltransferase
MLEVRTIGAALVDPLSAFFEHLRAAGDDIQFHPHPMTREEAERRVRYDGRDLYYVLIDGTRVLGYGMLRGWDEGYEIPSLGIAIHPHQRRRGLARLVMTFLHEAARRRSAKQVRLTVNADNMGAVRLYREFGYAFRQLNDGRLEGMVLL